MTLIMIDAGHGGADPGATYKGRKESDDVLAIATGVAAGLRQNGITVDETRTTDKTVSLQGRSNMELKKKYDYFISIHRNAIHPERAKGAEVFIYNKTKKVEPKQMAQKIQRSLVAVGFVNRGVKAANFHVLRETRSAAVLLEIGFIDHTEDNRLFDAKRNQIVSGIVNAVLEQCGRKKAAAAAKENYYIVNSNDTLFGIAQRNKTTVDILVKKNGIRNPNSIQIGQKIKLP